MRLPNSPIKNNRFSPIDVDARILNTIKIASDAPDKDGKFGERCRNVF
jgi:hypothetical protein